MTKTFILRIYCGMQDPAFAEKGRNRGKSRVRKRFLLYSGSSLLKIFVHPKGKLVERLGFERWDGRNTVLHPLDELNVGVDTGLFQGGLCVVGLVKGHEGIF
jgi:hypothetical protein